MKILQFILDLLRCK